MPTWTPPAEIYETPQEYAVQVELAGINREDVAIEQINNILIVRNDLPDDLVYELLKAMYDDAPRLAAAHAAMKAFKLEDGLKGITGVVELHPGAARFFKSKGMSN